MVTPPAIFEYILVAIAVASIVLWGTHLSRASRGERLLEPRARRPVPWAAVDIAVALGGYFVLALLIQGGTVQALGIEAENLAQMNDVEASWLLFSDAAAKIAAVALVVFWLIARYRIAAADIGLPGKPLEDVRIGVACFVMFSVPVLAVNVGLTKLAKWVHLDLPQHPIIERYREDPSALFLLASVVSAVLVAPVVEEFFFRGLLQGLLEKLFAPRDEMLMAAAAAQAGDVAEDADVTETTDAAPAEIPDEAETPPSTPAVEPDEDAAALSSDSAVSIHAPLGHYTPRHLAVVPIAITSLLFALAHYGHGPAPVPLFLLSLGLGYIYHRTYRLLPCIIVHFLLNGFSLLALWLSGLGLGEQG